MRGGPGAAGTLGPQSLHRIEAGSDPWDWPEIVALALDPNRKLASVVGGLLGADEDHELTREEAILALKTVARRLRRQQLSVVLYENERGTIHASNAKGRRHVGEAELPNWHQIARVFGSAEAALEAAGLVGGPKRKPPPVATGVDWTEALDRCVDIHGAMPSVTELEAFAGAQGFALARRRLSMAEHLAELRGLRAERGLDHPGTGSEGAEAGLLSEVWRVTGPSGGGLPSSTEHVAAARVRGEHDQVPRCRAGRRFDRATRLPSLRTGEA